MKTNRILSLLAVTAALCGAGVAADKATTAKAAKPYPLDTCVVSGEKLGGMGDAFVFVQDGREIKLCCKSCKKDFDKDTKKFVAKVDEAAKKVKPYALTTCLVSGEKLGAMADEEYVFIYQGQEIKLCCKNCKKDFDKDPKKFTAKLVTK